MWLFVKSALFAGSVALLSLPAQADTRVNMGTVSGAQANISWGAALGALDTTRLDFDAAPTDTYSLDRTFTARTRALLAGILNNVRFDVYSQSSGKTTVSRPMEVNLLSKVGTASVSDFEVTGPFTIAFSNMSILGALVSRIDNVGVTGTATLVSVPEIGAEGAMPAAIVVLGALAVITGARRRQTFA